MVGNVGGLGKEKGIMTWGLMRGLSVRRGDMVGLARALGIAFVGIQRVRVWRAEAGPCCLVSPPCSAGCQRLRRWYGVYVQPLLPACRGGLESVGDGATRCGRPVRP